MVIDGWTNAHNVIKKQLKIIWEKILKDTMNSMEHLNDYENIWPLTGK